MSGGASEIDISVDFRPKRLLSMSRHARTQTFSSPGIEVFGLKNLAEAVDAPTFEVMEAHRRPGAD